ncbi:hypothetical protein BAC1_00057 [uncultured bacterium]|nr:hypothetical protein BAC1_00057 [uncultured bacterium]
MKKSVITLFILLFSVSVFAEDKSISDYDGHNWNTWDYAYKYGFVTGFINSANYFKEDISVIFPAIYNQTNKEKVNKVYGKYPRNGKSVRFTQEELTVIEMSNKSDCYLNRNNRAEELAVYNISNAQIVDGLNQLYQDFKNQNIPLNDAIYVVKRQISGYSQEEIERVLLYLRSGKNNLDALEIRDEKGTFLKYIQFP